MPAVSIQLLTQANIASYDRSRGPADQPETVPSVFSDAMEVRKRVFVDEQNVPLKNELDEDDQRCCHWVAYKEEGEEGKEKKKRMQKKKKNPIGTIRLVPYPHPPRPHPGGNYEVVNGALQLTGAIQAVYDDVEGGAGSSSSSGHNLGSSTSKNGAVACDTSPLAIKHDASEPYVKLSRLAVDKAFRHGGTGRLLVDTALDWMRTHPTYFDSTVTSAPFKGLVCVHAQKAALGFWQSVGFVVDQDMGVWLEEGMLHVGMLRRLDIE